jgi:hypothetical protein
LTVGVPLQHPAYRAFENWRIETNNAGVAILLGLRLGHAHIGQMPPVLRQKPLSALVDVDDAWRLDLPGDEVMEVMSRAETTYAAMAIPFHIAVYNEFLVTALGGQPSPVVSRETATASRANPSLPISAPRNQVWVKS